MEITYPLYSSSQPNKLPPFSLIDSIHASEASFLPDHISPKHKFEIVDDHRSGKIVVQLNGRCVYTLPNSLLSHQYELTRCGQAEQVRRHQPALQRAADRARGVFEEEPIYGNSYR